MLSVCEKQYLHYPCTTLLTIHLKCACLIPEVTKASLDGALSNLV